MRTRIISVLVVSGILFLSSLAMASTEVQNIDKLLSEQKFFEALEAIHHLFIEVWNKSPLKITKILFVSKAARGVGVYEARKNNVFKPGEEMLIYIRPVGYTLFKRDNKYRFGFILGATLFDADGRKIFQRKGWGKFLWSSYAPNTEIYVNFRIRFKGIKPGKYVLSIMLSDLFSEKTTSAKLPFVVSD